MVTTPNIGSRNWGPGLNAALDELQDQIDSVAPATAARFYPEAYGAAADGVTDDTAAFVAAIAAAMPVNGTVELAAKTYAISDELHFVGEGLLVGHTVTLVGQGYGVDLADLGDGGSIIRALAVDAALIWGDIPTGASLAGVTHYGGRSGTNRDFMFDGNQVATRGIQVGVVFAYGTWQNVHATRVNGDDWLVTAQNCTFIECYGDQAAGNGWTFDFGMMQCTFINCHGINNDGWNMQMRQSGGMDWAVVQYPQNNYFLSCIVEVSGASEFTNAGLGGFHLREGTDIVFDRFDMTDEDDKPGLVLTPSTANGYVSRNTVRDCRINKIYLDANDGSGNAQLMGGTEEPLLLSGWNIILEIVNGSQNFIYDDSHGQIPTYTPEGVGAATQLRHQFWAKTPTADLLRLVNSDGDTMFFVGADGSIGARWQQDEQVAIGDVFGFPGITFGPDGNVTLTNQASGRLTVTGSTLTQPPTDVVPVVTKGHASGTANLQEWQNSAGTVKAAVTKDGIFTGLVPTASPGDNDTSPASTAFVQAANTALLTSSISNADTTHAPNGDAVFDALALKRNLADVWRRDINLTFTPNVLSGTWTFAGTYGYSSSGASATPYTNTWYIDAAPGTWAIEIVCYTSNNSGIHTFDYSIDGGSNWVTIASGVDLYSAGLTEARVVNATGIVLPSTTGRFDLRVNGGGTKNGSSSAYYALTSRAALRRTS